MVILFDAHLEAKNEQIEISSFSLKINTKKVGNVYPWAKISTFKD